MCQNRGPVNQGGEENEEKGCHFETGHDYSNSHGFFFHLIKLFHKLKVKTL